MGQGIVQISLEALAQMLMLPEDCRPVGCYYDQWRKRIDLVIEKPDIPPTQEGDCFPYVSPLYQYHTTPHGHVVSLQELKVGSSFGVTTTSLLSKDITP